jgi:molybdopterin converting factor small subunit
MPTLQIPTALRTFTDSNASVSVEGGTVGELLADLVKQYPALGDHLFDDAGHLRSFVNLFLGDTNVKALDGLDTTVPPDGSVLLVPAIAGGV